MANKNLQEKIKDVIFWIFIFFILYLIIGYLLNSSWLEKSLKFTEIYEILRDALTLSAYFLAPTIAYIFLEDWREQHAEKAIEEESTRLYEEIEGLIEQLYSLLYEIGDERNFKNNSCQKILDDFSHFRLSILRAKQLNDRINARGKEANEFSAKSYKILKKTEELVLEVSRLSVTQLKIQNPAKYNEYLDTTDDEYAEHITREYEGLDYQITSSLTELMRMKKEIKLLCDELKIKI